MKPFLSQDELDLDSFGGKKKKKKKRGTGVELGEDAEDGEDKENGKYMQFKMFVQIFKSILKPHLVIIAITYLSISVGPVLHTCQL